MDFVDFVTKWNANIVAIANIFIAIGTLILAFGIPWSILSSRQAEKDSFYAALDQTYFEIKRLVIEHPHLAATDPAGKTPDQLVQYDAYAFMIWNFIESIYDYSKSQKALAETWSCILRYEARTHAEWFKNLVHQQKFKTPFVDHIKARGYLSHDGSNNK